MEYFKIVNVRTTEEKIREALTLENLEQMSTQLIQLGQPDEREVSIGSIWGEFTLSRDIIRGGLRFALVECPNALAWTVTTGFSPAPESIVLHLTINRQQKKPSFTEEIEDFLKDQKQCLEAVFNSKDAGVHG